MPTDDRGVLDLGGTDLRRANLSATHLKKVSFGGAHLEEAWLAGARLETVNFVNAHLEGAVLFGADLERTVLLNAHLKGAMADEGTRWKEGFDWQAADVQRTPGVVFSTDESTAPS
jgi:uncharacterized protein YjbI with pentapeptide repeats